MTRTETEKRQPGNTTTSTAAGQEAREISKQPKSKQEWEAYLKANRREIDQAAKAIARMHAAGDTEGIAEHANRDAEEYAQEAIEKRDAAIKSDKLEEE